MQTQRCTSQKLSILGVALGNPASTTTYSGVPYHLFQELRRLGCLVGVANSAAMKPTDVLRGGLDFWRTLWALRPKRNSLWRYRQRGMETLSKRFQRIERIMPQHDMVLQIGVGAIPIDGVKLVSHVEISVAWAINSEIYAKNFGFYGKSPQAVNEAIEGEKRFLERCDIVWTNSEWTAQGLRQQGVESDRIHIQPPAAGMEDPGLVERDWKQCNILFVGNSWHLKGGDILVKAFEEVRKANKKARLNIVGCTPKITMDGVRVWGYLNKRYSKERKLLERLYRESTIFCMPSQWESTGIVYMEAALWGLPLVMFIGQGREKIFPSSMALHLDRFTPKDLAQTLIDLSRSENKMMQMGKYGRQLVLENYTWKKVTQKLYARMKVLIS